MQVWEVGKSKCLTVTVKIRVTNTRHESVPTSNWSFIAREFVEPKEHRNGK